MRIDGDRFHRLFLLSLGMLASFLVCAYIEETVFTSLTDFHHSRFFTFFEFLMFVVLSLSVTIVSDQSFAVFRTRPKAPIKYYVLISALIWVARVLTNKSLEFLNYPSQVIFKSSKLPVVMTCSIFILKKSYKKVDYISALMMATSVCIFSLGDSEVSPSFNLVGVSVVLFSLVADGVHANYQELVMIRYKAPENELILITNTLGTLFALQDTLFFGEFFEAIEYFNVHLWLWGALVLRGIVVYVGVHCIVTMIKSYGAVVVAIVSTVRKVLTIVFSFVLFPKPFSWMYVWAVVVFSGGTMFSTLMRYSGNDFSTEFLRFRQYKPVHRKEKDDCV